MHRLAAHCLPRPPVWPAVVAVDLQQWGTIGVAQLRGLLVHVLPQRAHVPLDGGHAPQHMEHAQPAGTLASPQVVNMLHMST